MPHRDARRDGAAVPAEAGFTLLEVIIALAMMGTVMAALTPFLVSSVAVVNRQRIQQVAIQVANDAVDQVRSLRGSALLSGRGEAKSRQQWNAAPVPVQPYLTVMKLAWDPLLTDPASTLGDQAPLPTKAQSVSIGGVTYGKTWYVGRCLQQTGAADGACLHPDAADPDPEAADLPFFRIVVSVTWSTPRCRPNECSYVTTTLTSTADDPVFNVNRPPPLVTNPGALTAYRTQPVSKQVYASGGQLPLTWTATGLPPGLTISTTGLVTGTPTTVGTYPVTLTATDRVGATDGDGFSWVVASPVTVTNPGNQVGRVGTAVSLPVAGGGGVAPLAWTAVDLPTGLSINAANGTISGTPTTVETRAVVVTATDSKGKAVDVPFGWRILTPVTVTDPGAQNVVMYGPVNRQLTAAGGAPPYTWRAEQLPPGLTINSSTGEISGTVTGGTRFLSVVYAADSAGMETGVVVPFTVAAALLTDLRVSAPTAATADRVTTVGQAASVTASVAGGLGPYTWTATGLPPGLTITGATISGTPTTRGTYTVRLGVRDLGGAWAYLMFTWRVQ